MQCHACQKAWAIREHSQTARSGEEAQEAQQQAGTISAGLQKRSEDGKAKAQGKAEKEVSRCHAHAQAIGWCHAGRPAPHNPND